MTPEQRQNLSDYAKGCGAEIKATERNDNVMVTFAWGDFEVFSEGIGVLDPSLTPQMLEAARARAARMGVSLTSEQIAAIWNAMVDAAGA